MTNGHSWILFLITEHCVISSNTVLCVVSLRVLIVFCHTLSSLIHSWRAILLSPHCQWSNSEDFENNMTPLGTRSFTTISWCKFKVWIPKPKCSRWFLLIKPLSLYMLISHRNLIDKLAVLLLSMSDNGNNSLRRNQRLWEGRKGDETTLT